MDITKQQQKECISFGKEHKKYNGLVLVHQHGPWLGEAVCPLHAQVQALYPSECEHPTYSSVMGFRDNQYALFRRHIGLEICATSNTSLQTNWCCVPINRESLRGCNKL